jgi:predicted DNA-binding transcriptional regulator AlpA
MSSIEQDVYLKPREAAAYLKTSQSTLAKRRLYGDGPKFSRIGSAIRYSKADLDEFMDARRVQTTSDLYLTNARTRA